MGVDCLYSQGLGHGARKIMGSRPTWTTLRDLSSRSFLQNKRPFLNILIHFGSASIGRKRAGVKNLAPVLVLVGHKM